MSTQTFAELNKAYDTAFKRSASRLRLRIKKASLMALPCSEIHDVIDPKKSSLDRLCQKAPRCSDAEVSNEICDRLYSDCCNLYQLISANYSAER